MRIPHSFYCATALSTTQNILTILSNGKAVVKRFRIERMLPSRRFSSVSKPELKQGRETSCLGTRVVLHLVDVFYSFG